MPHRYADRDRLLPSRGHSPVCAAPVNRLTVLSFIPENSTRVNAIAARVVSKASREHPGDRVLRHELKAAGGLTQGEGRLISKKVFDYFRWLGWLKEKTADGRLREAGEWAARFAANPESVSDAELLEKAVPGWTHDVMDVKPEWVRSLQQEPAIWLRTKPGERERVAAELGDCEPGAWGRLPDALRYRGERDLFRTAEFHKGSFEVQDISSQAVGVMCDPKPGETWWDACAGEGGKTLHLAELMANRGSIWATDRAEWRLKRLKMRAARAGVFNYRAKLWPDGSAPPTRTMFHGVLVDAPCSGLGTWQRNPHARWSALRSDVMELAAVQKSLLAAAVGNVKSGGRLIYAVCTLTRAETSEVEAEIQRRFPELTPCGLLNPFKTGDSPAGECWFWPWEIEGNGMFAAGWRRG